MHPLIMTIEKERELWMKVRNQLLEVPEIMRSRYHTDYLKEVIARYEECLDIIAQEKSTDL